MLELAQNKRDALLAVFGVYLLLIPMFAALYYLAYRRDRTHFIFARDILERRLAEQRSEADARIASLGLVLAYFSSFREEHLANGLRLETVGDLSTTVLRDGRRIVLERRVHYGPGTQEHEWEPWARLFSKDGATEWEGQIDNCGFLSNFPDAATFLLSTLEPLTADLERTTLRRHELDSPDPKVWRYVDFLYFSTITQSTVGYGDILPNSSAVRAMVIAQVIGAYGLLVVVLNFVLSGLAKQ